MAPPAGRVVSVRSPQASELAEPRSPLLCDQETPIARQRRTLRLRIGLRSLAVLMLFAATAAVVLPVRLGKNPPVRWLGWLHDHLYLPIKGYGYTLTYPLSAGWLTGLLVLGILGLAGFVAARPMTRRLHIALIRRALGRPRLRTLLEWWCTKPVLMNLGTGLVLAVAEHDRQEVLTRIDSHEQAPAGTTTDAKQELAAHLRAAGHLSLFIARVTTRRVTTQRARSTGELLRAASLLNGVLLRCELYPAAGHRGPHQEVLAQLATLLALLCPEPELVDSPETAETRFGAPSLARDLGELLPREGDEDREPDLQCVLDGVQLRRQLVDSIRRQIEQSLPFTLGTSPPSLQLPARDPELPEPGVAPLAVDVAMVVAVRLGVPEIALAYLESLEALRFALLASGGAGAGQALGSTQLADFAAVLCHRLPRTEDYRTCALLLNRQLAAADDLRQARGRASGILWQEDLELVRSRIEQLLAAAADPGQALPTSHWEVA